MSIWFTADPHLGHDKAAEERGFASTAEHDEAVLNMIASTPKTGPLFILGDLVFGTQKSAKLRQLLLLAGDRAVIVLGNHDRAHPMFANSWRHLNVFAQGGGRVVTAATVRWGGVTFNVSHFPYAGDHTDVDRFPQWRLRDEGAPIIHGHTHSRERLSFTPTSTQLNVSPEARGYTRAVNIGELGREARLGGGVSLPW